MPQFLCYIAYAYMWYIANLFTVTKTAKKANLFVSETWKNTG